MNEITTQWLTEKQACFEGAKWFNSQKETNTKKIIIKLIEEKQNTWAAWLLLRIMSNKQKVQFAIFAAQQVLSIFEKTHPKDTRPRKAIEEAQKFINKEAMICTSKDIVFRGTCAASAAASAVHAAAYAKNSEKNDNTNNQTDNVYVFAYASSAFTDAYIAAAMDGNEYNSAPYKTTKKEIQIKMLFYGVKLLNLT